MKLKFTSLIIFFLSLFFGFLFAKPAFANSFLLSGHISDSSNNSIVGATVSIIDVNSSASVGNVTTNSSGDYSLSVVEGTYNVQVTPSFGSNLTPAIALNQTISANTILNFVLAQSGLASLSGYIRDSQGHGLVNQSIRLSGSNGSSNRIFTDSTGHYSIILIPDSYHITLEGGGPAPAPGSYFITTDIGINQSIIQNFTIPSFKVTVHVQDGANNAVGNVVVSAHPQGASNIIINRSIPLGGGVTGVGYSASSGTTDLSGNIDLYLIPTGTSEGAPYVLTAIPPNGSQYFMTTLSNVAVIGDSLQTITLQQPVVLSGHIRDRDGTGLENQRISFFGSNSSSYRVSTDSSGYYSVTLAPGSYNITLEGRSSTAHVPQSYLINTSLGVNQDITQDFTIPAYKVETHVQDATNTSVDGVVVSAQPQGAPNIIINRSIPLGNGITGVGYSATSGTTDTNGNTNLWLIPTGTSEGTPYVLTATPPSGSGYYASTLQNVIVTADSSQSITLQKPTILSGYIRDSQGHGLVNQSIRLSGSNGSSNRIFTDSTGHYSITLIPDSYHITLEGGGPAPAPGGYFITTDIGINQSMEWNITIPTYKIATHVQDGTNNAVLGVVISAQPQGAPNIIINRSIPLGGGVTGVGYSASSGITDINGNKDLYLIPTGTSEGAPYVLTATPPSGSSFSPFTISNVVLTQNISEVISLQYNHAAPTTTVDLQAQHEDGTYSDPTTVTLSATADTGYSIANMYYKVDGGAQQTYTAPFTVSGSGPHHIEYWSVDNSGVQESHKTKDFTIYVNQSPYVTPLSDVTINQNDTYTATGSFTDPDSTSWTATVDYGDGPVNLPLNPDKTFTLSHQYTTAGVYTVIVVVKDDGGATGTTMATITVNAPPVIDPIQGGTMNEGQTYTENGSFTDPDSNSWTATIDYGDGTGSQNLALNSDTTFTLNHLYEDNGAYTVTVSIIDNQGATSTRTATVTVNNVIPTVGTISVSSNPTTVNTAVAATASFTDPGILDTHTTVFDWGDGMTSPGDVTETNGSGSVSGSHAYLSAGVYTVTLTLMDKDSGSGQSVYQYESVYNPTPQGLFSGARILTSPAGAYADDPNLTGQVQFGVMAKYQNGSPTGNVSMKFKAANLEFASTVINVLVTANGKATLMGTGTINGSGDYNFLVTGIDGATDTIRFQITDSSNNIVYDSQPGAAYTDDPVVSVTGQVVIH